MLPATCTSPVSTPNPPLTYHSGGSVLTDFISRNDGPIKGSKFHAVVRTKEQVEALSQLGVNVLNMDLNSKAEVIEAVVRNESTITPTPSLSSRN